MFGFYLFPIIGNSVGGGVAPGTSPPRNLRSWMQALQEYFILSTNLFNKLACQSEGSFTQGVDSAVAYDKTLLLEEVEHFKSLLCRNASFLMHATADDS